VNRVEKAFNSLGGSFMVRMGWVANLGTTGARTGQPRTAPVGFLERADRTVLIGAGGTGRAWAANLRASPACTLMVRGKRDAYVATALDGAERDEALAELVASMPRSFRGATWTDIFVLAPAAGGAAVGGTAGGDVGVEGPSS
jgi:deazaflavin-dependent oxidoreductase (nitroreductase family)